MTMDVFVDHLDAVFVTLKLATVTVIVLLLLGTPLAWWLSSTRSRFKIIVEAFVALPLVLPPTVLGFYLLMALGTQGTIGRWFQSWTGETLAFSFGGLVIASTLYSLPFVVQPLQTAFESVSRRYLETAQTLGASSRDAFFSVICPLSKRGFITATVLGFAHTLGEFGVVLMVGGNIPGKTQVLSIAIYDQVETLNWDSAHLLSMGLLFFSFSVLFIVFWMNRQFPVHSA